MIKNSSIKFTENVDNISISIAFSVNRSNKLILIIVHNIGQLLIISNTLIPENLKYVILKLALTIETGIQHS